MGRRIVVMKLICSLGHCECNDHTVHKLSQRRLTAEWLAPRENDCSRMHKWLDAFRTALVCHRESSLSHDYTLCNDIFLSQEGSMKPVLHGYKPIVSLFITEGITYLFLSSSSHGQPGSSHLPVRQKLFCKELRPNRQTWAERSRLCNLLY